MVEAVMACVKSLGRVAATYSAATRRPHHAFYWGLGLFGYPAPVMHRMRHGCAGCGLGRCG